jgi:hypothetical protein
MARTKNGSSKVDPFVAPGLKYAGRIEVLGGPVPLQVQHRPYTRDQRDRPLGAEGKDLRPERPQRQTEPPAALKKKKGK